jgi:signal transduction histidine kinase
MESKNGELDDCDKVKIVFELRDMLHATYDLVENMLNWSRSQIGALGYCPQQLNFNKLLQDVLAHLAANARMKSIALETNIPDNTVLCTDENYLHIILRNLISNAVKFTPKNGTIIVSLENVNDGHVISIQDTGTGISQESINMMLDKQTFHTSYGTDNEQGSGLGLNICIRLIETMEGNLWIESAVNKGTTVFFSIPERKGQKAAKNV